MPSFPKQLLEPISGFPELSPSESIALTRFLDVIRKHYERAGYAPLVTPLVERPEVLAAKAEGEITTQIYGLRLLNPHEGASDEKDVAIRYDHTVPLARYIAAHSREVAFPFRRYAIGPVLRGERAKDGRYRQFTQADIDVVGDGTLALAHDAEMVRVLADIFTELAIGSFTIRINNRKALAGLIRGAGLESGEVGRAMHAIDRLEKVGREETARALTALGMDARSAQLLDALTTIHSTDDALSFLKGQVIDEEYAEGVHELGEVIKLVRAYGVAENSFTLDLSIARGLDYYTGSVFETRLDDAPDLGSIASGGRYEHLASAFTDREFPGVGISIGVTRLLLRLIKARLVDASASTVAPLLITTAEIDSLPAYLAVAQELRANGVDAELYLEKKALDKQLAFADKRGFAYVLIAKKEHLDAGVFILRNLKTGEQKEFPKAEIVSAIKEALK